MDKKWSDPNTMSEYFIKFIINREPFDFDAFKTRGDFDRYGKELEQFLKEEGSPEMWEDED